MEKARRRREEQKLEDKEKELGRLMKDIDVGGRGKGKEEPAVMSDIESSDEEAGQGVLERDEDEEMQDEGLQEKYERVGKQNEPGTDPLLDASLKRYLHANN